MKARRRAVVVTALVATAMLLPVSAAHAAVTVRIDSPSAGDTLTAPVELRATTTFSIGDGRPESVEIRLLRADGEPWPGTAPVALDCKTGCGILEGSTGRWAGATFDPVSLAPFADPHQPSCNGAYGLQARADNGSWQGGIGVVIKLPTNRPHDVSVTTGPSRATVEWKAPNHPDLNGYTVEQRRSTSGDWKVVAEVGPSVTSFTQTNLSGGFVEYRVKAWRGDGLDGDKPLVACSDTGRDLPSAWSNTASGTVPSPTSSPSPSPTDGATEPDGESTEPTEESTEPTEESTEPTEAPTEPDASPSPTPTTRSGSGSRAAPPPVESQERRDVEAPEISQPERRERYYGEDDEFSEELDFGAAPPEDRDLDGEPGTVTIRVPGGLQSVLGVELDMDRVLVPVAGGMILLSLGLHLRRWTRLGLE